MKKSWRNSSPEDKRRKELIRELMKFSPVKDGEGLNSLIKGKIKDVVEEALGCELEAKIYTHRKEEGFQNLV